MTLLTFKGVIEKKIITTPNITIAFKYDPFAPKKTTKKTTER